MTHATPPVLRVRSAPLAGLAVSGLVLLVSLRLLQLLGPHNSTYWALLGLLLLGIGVLLGLHVQVVVRQQMLWVHYPFRIRRKTYVFVLSEISGFEVRAGLFTSLRILLGPQRTVSFVVLSPRFSALLQFRQWAHANGLTWQQR